MTTRLGFIGLGAMGRPMAENLLQQGYNLSIYGRRSETVEPLVARGALACNSPREVGEKSDITITMVTTDEDTWQVLLGDGGVSEGASPGSVVVVMSTISPANCRAIAEKLACRQLEMLDAPVSGGPIGAKEATLAIMVGGREETFHRILPVFNCLGKRFVYIGPNGAGQVAKACNQTMLLITLQAIAEAFTFARKNQVPLEMVYQALAGGSAHSRILEVMGPRMIERNYSPGVEARLHYKDLGIIMQEAHNIGLMLPGTALATQLFNALIGRGAGQEDSSQVIEIIEAMMTGRN